ncbi:MAG: hypothetical protein AAFQ15_07155 [Pseudomonadota bacterium]
MIKTTQRLSLLSTATALLAAACAQQPVTDTAAVDVTEVSAETPAKKVTLGPAISTVKPGASVTFSHPDVKTVAVGDNGSVEITVNEGYPSGTLTLEASGGDGLDVFGANRVVQLGMSDVTTHTWRVDFQPQSDGVHYINVQATARPEDGVFETRAYAVRINAGAWVNAKAEAATPMEMLDNETPAVMLEAQETIEER